MSKIISFLIFAVLIAIGIYILYRIDAYFNKYCDELEKKQEENKGEKNNSPPGGN